MTLTLQSIAQALGGKVSGREVLAPTPGHSKHDRGTAIRLAPGAPDGLLVSCYNGGWSEVAQVKDTLRAAGLLPSLNGTRRELSPAEQEAIRRAEAERLAERLVAQAKAAQIARQTLAQAVPADPAHPYLVAKRIPPEGLYTGADSYGYGGALLIPMIDHKGEVWNVQSIVPGRKVAKLYVKGGRTPGLFWRAGNPFDRVVIGEGMATVAAVRRATGLPVIAAMTCHNLPEVARLVRAKLPDATLIIAADDDEPGRKAASIAANETGALIALPEGIPA